MTMTATFTEYQGHSSVWDWWEAECEEMREAALKRTIKLAYYAYDQQAHFTIDEWCAGPYAQTLRAIAYPTAALLPHEVDATFADRLTAAETLEIMQ